MRDYLACAAVTTLRVPRIVLIRASAVASWSVLAVPPALRDAGATARRVTFRAEDGATLTRRVLRAIAASGSRHRSAAYAEAIACRLGRRGIAAIRRRIRGHRARLSRRRRARRVRDRRESCEGIPARAAGGDPGQHRHRRRLNWGESRGARRRRRSRRAVDRAALAGNRLQGTAHRSGDEEIRCEAGAARRQHEGSVCGAIDPPSHDYRSRTARSSPHRRGRARNGPALARRRN